MNYPKNRSKWTQSELDILKVVGKYLPIEILCASFNKHSRSSILSKLHDTGIKKERRNIITNSDKYTNMSLGNYISGFVDGEGCFGCRKYILKRDNSERYIIEFRIALRGDDKLILEQIQKYFNCGKLFKRSTESQRLKGINAKDQVEYRVANTFDLWTKVVPHFDKYPLRAKKKRDYITWRKAVEYSINCNRRYSPTDRQFMDSLIIELREGRGWDGL